MAAPVGPVREVALDAVAAIGGVAAAAWVHAADVACYPAPLQATRARIDRLCAGFPAGVRLYIGWTDGAWRPVGYSAWHPIAPGLLDDARAGRWPAEVPIEPTPTGAAYLFNYSVVPGLIGSPVARALMARLDAAVAPSPMRVADVVSDHGRRAAARWGMQPVVRRMIRGAPWELWARG